MFEVQRLILISEILIFSQKLQNCICHFEDRMLYMHEEDIEIITIPRLPIIGGFKKEQLLFVNAIF